LIKLSDYVIQRIAQEVRHLFFLPGGGCMHLVDSLGRCKEIEHISNLHEQACAIAADAYGQYTNHLGVALVTTGPGGTNTITGVAGAWLESTPCLFVSGQVKRADMVGSRGTRQMGFQEIQIVRIVSSITKYAVTVTEPESIRYHLDKAIYLAQQGRRGPVWIDIPLDVQAAQIDETALRAFDPGEVESLPDHELLARQVRQTIELLNQSERPVILVGNGVRSAQAIDLFLSLIEQLNIPVLTTWKMLDTLPEAHRLYIGRPGMVGQRAANFAQQNSDWLLTIGARLDLGQTGYTHPTFARAAKKIMVDIDPAEIGKMAMPIDVPICGDAGAFLAEFLRQLDRVAPKDRASWLARCREWKTRYPVILPEYWHEKKGVNNYVLLQVLAEEMADGDLLVPGSSGACSEVTAQAFQMQHRIRTFGCHGLGPMGFGVPASIGACIASGRRRTICIDGDGGFQMNIQELETIRRLSLPIKFFILNNDGYGSIRATQQAYFAGRYVGANPASGLTFPDTLKIADAYGLGRAQILNHEQIRARVRAVLDQNGPVICDVKITPHQVTAPRVTSRQMPDGSMVSNPLEDLWPLLERDEFLANMLVPPIQ
jgi:acetolactate synthase-1/2/3 large subunit